MVQHRKKEKEAFVKKVLALLLVLVLGVSLAGLANGKVTNGKVGIVLDVGGRGDLSFNDMGFKGTDQAAKDFGLQMDVAQSSTAADYLPNIRNMARSGNYKLILCVGYLLGDAIKTAAAEFPDQKFAIIDSVVKAPNVMSVVFRENESSALIGALAAMTAAEKGYKYAGIVLGIEIPVLYHFEAGFRFGMDWGLKKYAEVTGKTPDVGLLYTYTGTFSDIAQGKAATGAMLAQGAVGVYNVAGPLGVGDLEAVTEAHTNAKTTYGPPYYFGVDSDQDWMGNGYHALASGMKRVDNACYNAVKSVVDNTFKGVVLSLGLKQNGVGISGVSQLANFIDFGIAGGAVKADNFYNIDRKSVV